MYVHFRIESQEKDTINLKWVFRGGGYSDLVLYDEFPVNKEVSVWEYMDDGIALNKGNYTVEFYNAEGNELIGGVSYEIE